MFEQIIIFLHVLVALAIVGLILLQQGKGADMGASFGGGGSQTLFGSSGGGNVLTQATAILAALFFATSFGLAIIAKQKASLVPTDDLLTADEVAIEQLAPTGDPEFGNSTLPLEDIPTSLSIDSAELSAPTDIVDEIPE